MSFPCSNRRILTNIFGTYLTQIANATTNLSDDIIYAASLLNINKDTLSRMMLSSDLGQIECINRIKNLVNSLRQYEDGNLPEQLIQYISQLNQYINQNPLNENTLPSYINILCPRSLIEVNLTTGLVDNYLDYDYPDYNYPDYDYPEPNTVPVSLRVVLIENIKDDVCVICFINLKDSDNNDPVIETVCKHQYHNNCICSWTNIKRECPLCKNEL